MPDLDLDIIRETTLLKTLLESPNNIDIIYQISDTLKYNQFKDNTYAYIYKAIIEIASKRGSVDYITVAENIKKSELGEICTPEAVMALKDISAKHIDIKGAMGYAEEICTTSQIYQAKIASDKIGGANTLSEIKHHYTDLGRALDASSSKPLSDVSKDTYTVYEEIGEALNKKKQGLHEGMNTGYYRLDSMMGGLLPGEVTVIGGRPSTGKSTLALGCAWNIARSAQVGFASVEMARQGIYFKMFGMCSGIPLIRLRQCDLTDKEYQHLATIIPRQKP